MATGDTGHTTDGDLVRLLDGEAGPGDAEVTAHVNACAACRSRLESLLRRSTLLTEALAAADPPAADRARLRPPVLGRGAGRRPAQRAVWSRAGVRAAAGVLLVAGIAAATPARTWVLERVAHIRGGSAQPGGDTAPATTGPAHGSPSSAVSFTPASELLVIRLEKQQSAGTLELVAGQDSRSSVQATAGANGEAFVVLPSELRIRNTASSAASYRVVIAAQVRRVRVLVGDDRAIATVEVTPETRHLISLGSIARPAP